MPEHDDDLREIMDEYDLDEDQAEAARELIDEGVDEDIAAELAEEGISL